MDAPRPTIFRTGISRARGRADMSQSGFTIPEILAALALIAMISAFTVTAFTSYYRNQVLLAEAERVAGLVEEARSLTLASFEDTVYGVYFDAGEAVLFAGDEYAGDGLKGGALHPAVEITGIELEGASSEIVFERLSGQTAHHGDITFSLRAQPSRTRTVTVSPTGVVERP